MSPRAFNKLVDGDVRALVEEGERMAQDPTPECADHLYPELNAGELATAARRDPDQMTRDDWDDVYMDCESNGEGEARSMVRYAYEAGWRAARGVK